MSTLENLQIQEVANIVGSICLGIVVMIVSFKAFANENTTLGEKISSIINKLPFAIVGYILIIMAVPFAEVMMKFSIEVNSLILVLIGFLMFFLNYLFNRLV